MSGDPELDGGLFPPTLSDNPAPHIVHYAPGDPVTVECPGASNRCHMYRACETCDESDNTDDFEAHGQRHVWLEDPGWFGVLTDECWVKDWFATTSDLNEWLSEHFADIAGIYAVDLDDSGDWPRVIVVDVVSLGRGS